MKDLDSTNQSSLGVAQAITEDSVRIGRAETAKGRFSALSSIVFVVIAAGVFAYTQRNPDPLHSPFWDVPCSTLERLIVLWGLGLAAVILGILLAASSVVRSRLRRRLSWLALAMHGMLAIYGVIIPLAVAIRQFLKIVADPTHLH